MSTGLAAFTLFHVAISLVGIASGLVVVTGMLRSRRLDRWTAVFLIFTIATSVTGFLFPFTKFLPSHAVGILSLLILAIAVFARYRRQLQGRWRIAYVLAAMAAQYLNVFVLVVQLFLKIPALKALAPTQTEPPFAVAQGVVILLSLALTIFAVFKFRPVPPRSPEGSERSLSPAPAGLSR